jgi:hypothetical protein
MSARRPAPTRGGNLDQLLLAAREGEGGALLALADLLEERGDIEGAGALRAVEAIRGRFPRPLTVACFPYHLLLTREGPWASQVCVGRPTGNGTTTVENVPGPEGACPEAATLFARWTALCPALEWLGRQLALPVVEACLDDQQEVKWALSRRQHLGPLPAGRAAAWVRLRWPR